MDWIPAYLDLWVDDKADLSHATRSIFLRLCHAARRARRDGLVLLPPASASDEAGIMAIVRGKATEIKQAIVEMELHRMIAFEQTDDGRCVRILSWQNWVLSQRADSDALLDAPPVRRGGRPKKWASEADRKRARRASGNPDSDMSGNSTPEVSGNLSGLCPETCPETFPDASGNQFADNGGVRGGDQIKSDQKTAEKNEEMSSPAAATRQPADGVTGGGGQLALLADDAPSVPAQRKTVARKQAPPSPVTEVRDIWRAEWAAAGMEGPAPWDEVPAAATKRYLGEPGATIETARAAIVGMLRTPAGEWHRTDSNGRHATVQAALTGKHTVAFTNAGKAWLEAQREATRPRKVPPPPRPVPDMEEIKRRQQARLAQALQPNLPPSPET